MYSSVIRQKGESQNECFKKTKHAKYSDIRGQEMFVFFGKFALLCFLETSVLRFALLLYYHVLADQILINEG